jgi:hypothetical protein
MIIMDAVKVSPPYAATSVTALAAATPATVQRVAKIVAGWRQKDGLGAAIDAALQAS